MSCVKPLALQDCVDFVHSSTPFFRMLRSDPAAKVFYQYVPCWRCIQCRKDRITTYSDRCEYEFIKRGCGAFVTFTYDDYHILPHLRTDPVTGKPIATLSRLEAKRFMYRLNKLVKKQENVPFCQHDFKYVISGEYGDHGQIFDRPHYHALFFGLDFAFCKKLFARAWQGRGMIKVLPIRNGAPQYVLDYISTLEYGEQRKIKYNNRGLEPPFQTHSTGLGSGLYYSQEEYIRTHDNCYRWHGRDIPVPTYWRNKFLLPRVPYQRTLERLRTDSSRDGSLSYRNNFTPDYVSELLEYRLKKSQWKASNLRKKSKRPFLNDDVLLKELHQYYRDTDMYYRICHPSPAELGFTQEQMEDLYRENSYVSIQSLVEDVLLAGRSPYLDEVPF